MTSRCTDLGGQQVIEQFPSADGPGPEESSAAHFRKMYNRISELAKIGVWEFDLQSASMTWTDAVYDLFELPRGSALDRDEILKLYDPISRGEMEKLRNEAIERGTGFTLDIRIRAVSGNDKWIRLTADIEQEDGKSVRIFGTKQDITAERIAQEKLHSLQTELIHASRVNAMGTMASTLAHEVNQPLAAAANYMSAARRLATRETVGPDLSQSIEAALTATLRAGEIIRQVRDMIGKGQAYKSPLELEPVVKEAIALAGAGIANLDITCDLAPSVRVTADRIQIQQVLINLIRNACEAAGEACHVEIRSFRADDQLKICVSDTGPGIRADLLPKIFESFVTTKPDGLGIGLSISRTIIEAHGGRIRATNLPGGGASFCFTLPLWPAEPDAPPG